MLDTLAAERDAALEFEAAEASASERVVREIKSFFHNIPRVKNRLGAEERGKVFYPLAETWLADELKILNSEQIYGSWVTV